MKPLQWIGNHAELVVYLFIFFLGALATALIIMGLVMK